MKRALLIAVMSFLVGFALSGLVPQSPSKQAHAERSYHIDEAAISSPSPPTGVLASQACARCADTRRAAQVEALPSRQTKQSRALGPQTRIAAGKAKLELDLSYRGSPLPGRARLTLIPLPRGRARTVSWKPDDRAIPLEPGRTRIEIRAGELLKSEAITVEAAEGEQLQRSVALAGCGSGIFGRVVNADGYPLRGQLIVKRITDAALSPLELVARSDRSLYLRSSFAFAKLPQGRYVIAFTTDNHCADVLTEVEVGAEPVPLELTLPKVAAERAFEARLLDAGGGPLPAWSTDFLPVSSEDWGQITTRERGETALLYFDCPRVSRYTDSLEIQARHPRFGWSRAALRPGVDRAVELRFGEGARLRVALEGLESSDYEGDLELVWYPNDKPMSREARPDPEGEASLEGLSPGPGTLRLRVHLGGSAFELEKREVDLRPGENFVSVPIPRLHRVELRSRLKDEDTGWVRQAEGGSYQHFTFDDRGRAVVANLPAGRYEFSSGPIEVIAAVPCGPVILAHQAVSSWRVRVSQPGGLLAQLGFEDGDRIVGVEGRSLDQLLETDDGEAPKRLKLIRSGRSAELLVDLNKLFDLEALRGGSLKASND